MLSNIKRKDGLRGAGKGEFRAVVPRLIELARDSGFEAVFVENVHNRRRVPFFTGLGFNVWQPEEELHLVLPLTKEAL